MRRSLLVVAVLVTALFVSVPEVVTSTAVAAASDDRKKQEKRRVPAMTERTYRSLSEAQELIEAGTVAEAIELLNTVGKRRGLNSNERSQVWNTLAFAYYTLEDIPNTINAYVQVLAQEKIRLGLELNALKALYQLYYTEEDYLNALKYLDLWSELYGEPDPNALYLKATAFYQLKRYEESLQTAVEVEKVAIAQNKVVKEPWLYLQVVLYSELQRYVNVVPVLEKLIMAYPKKDYWIYLAGMYGELEQEENALGAYYAAYVQGMLTRESELVALSQRLLGAEVPFEAATILSNSIEEGSVEANEKNLKLVAQAWTMSQDTEEAIEAWAEAAKYAPDGESYYRLARALASDEQHTNAINAYEDAIEKGMDDPEDARFFMGISLVQLKKWDAAVTAFRGAAKDDKLAKQARQYITYARGEKRREAELAKMERELFQ